MFSNTCALFQMLPVQFQMSEIAISLADEKAATSEKLRRVEELECMLAEVERRLTEERAFRLR